MTASDTIFAVASGAGQAAITLIRISGADAGTMLRQLCGSSPPPARHLSLRPLRTRSGDLLDRAMVAWLPGPGSYTGEDCVELSLHGGRAVLQAVSAELLQLGARPAFPGEFTKRAFLAGRMDLLEAEAIGDLIQSETEAQRIQSIRQLEGGPRALLQNWADRLRKALAYQEALIDFPDEDLPPEIEQTLIRDLRALADEMLVQMTGTERIEKLHRGLVFAIVGPPNAGKSSLINVLARRDVAIVAATPGTTRDVLECTVVLAGVKVTFIDTAGLRETTDEIEAEGVRRARARAVSADLVLHVFEAGTSPPPSRSGELAIANKIDVIPAPNGTLGISVLHRTGLDQLEELLETHVERLTHAGGGAEFSHARHAAALRDARCSLERGYAVLDPELRAEELRLAMRALGRITGDVDVETVLDTIFSSFCIGK